MSRFVHSIQALALAWTFPYAVQCNSITAAITLGFDGSMCDHLCSPTRASPYFNSPSTQVQNALFGRAERGLAGRVVEIQGRFSF